MKHYNVDPQKLSEVFDNTTATYKFYWMLALLDVVRYGNCNEAITFTEMVARMIAKAWAPLTSGLITFSKMDRLSSRIHRLIFTTELKNCDCEERVCAYIMNNAEDPNVKEVVQQMTKYVPYRFLYPWLGYNPSNKRTEELSNGIFANCCPYSIIGNAIKINKDWIEYLNDHVVILEGFAKYNLTYYLMKYNNNIILPTEEVASATADGMVNTFNSSVGLASESFPGTLTGNSNTDKLIKQMQTKIKHLERQLQAISFTNSFKFESGTRNIIFASDPQTKE